jgi:hypothetical protein
MGERRREVGVYGDGAVESSDTIDNVKTKIGERRVQLHVERWRHGGMLHVETGGAGSSDTIDNVKAKMHEQRAQVPTATGQWSQPTPLTMSRQRYVSGG